MSNMSRANFRKQLQDGLNTVFGMEYKRHPEQWREIFTVQNSNKAYEEDVLMYGLGGGRVKEEGVGVQYDAGGEAWSARYVHETIALAFAITEEAIEDGLYGDLGAKFARSMARGMQHTKEVKGANILNNGFSSSHLMGDGKPLFATDHPLAGGGTWSNTLDTPADLSEAALEDILIQISQCKDDRGIPLALLAKKLIVHPSNTFTATRLLNATLRPGTSDNDPNAIKDMGMIPGGAKVNQRLTDPDAWFIITDCPDGLKHMVRKAIQRGMEGDFETGNARFKARERYVFGATNPRGAYGSAGG